MATVTGELEALGFDEVEPGIVLDTPENRRRIYRLEPPGWQYERVMDEDGMPSGYIRPLHPARLSERRGKPYEIYRDLLVDSEDPWSDYVGPDDFPMDAEAPHFILDRLRRWRLQDQEGIPQDERKPFPVRCEHVRADGTRCWLWAPKPQDVRVCGHHLKQAGRDQTRHALTAKIKLLEMTTDAVDNLEYLAYNAESEPVKLKATTEILDRAGVRAGVEIEISGEVEVRDPGAEVRARLEKIASRRLELEAAHEAEVVEGEVVEDDAR